MTPKEIYDAVNDLYCFTPMYMSQGPCGPSGPTGDVDDGWTEDVGYLEGAAYMLKEIADYKRKNP